MTTSFNQQITLGPFWVVCLFLVGLAGAGENARRSSLDSPTYDTMKAKFLNVDPAHFAEVVFSDYRGDTSQDLAKADGENLLELRINEGGFMGWHTFGGTYWADSLLHGGRSLARYMTGGSPHNNSPVGGRVSITITPRRWHTRIASTNEIPGHSAPAPGCGSAPVPERRFCCRCSRGSSTVQQIGSVSSSNCPWTVCVSRRRARRATAVIRARLNW